MPEKGDPEDLPQVLYLKILLQQATDLENMLESHSAMLFWSYVTTCVFMCALQAPWGIISVKAQNEDFETPMQPITIMRNSLVSIRPRATDLMLKALHALYQSVAWLQPQLGLTVLKLSSVVQLLHCSMI